MRIHSKRNLNRFISFALMSIVLLSLTACGIVEKKDLAANNQNQETPSSSDNRQRQASETPVSSGTKAELPQPIAKTSAEGSASKTDIPGGSNVDEEDAMFTIVLGKPKGMGEPAEVIEAHFDEGDTNYFFSIIPHRDDIQINVENIYVHDLHFSDLVNILTNEVTANLGEYYLVNAYVKPQPDLYMCLLVVAQDGDEQGSFLVDPVEMGESGEFIVSSGKVPHGLMDNKMQALSSYLAGVVWLYGEELGWVNEWGETDGSITPEQLALSQSFCNAVIRDYIGAMDYGYLEEPYYSEKSKEYEEVFFPGIKISSLPKLHRIAPEGHQILSWIDTTETIFSAPSADEKTGSNIVHIFYENTSGFFEYFYRVDWEATGPLDVYKPFQYRLKGIQPLAMYPLGHGEIYDHYCDLFLHSDSAAAALEKLGVADSKSLFIDKPGLWGAGDSMLVRAWRENDDSGMDTYILLDYDEDAYQITHLGAATAAEYVHQETLSGWADLGIITIPPGWEYEMHMHDDIVIHGQTTSADLPMWAGWLMSDSIESELESCNYYEEFLFYDNQPGYMLFFDEYITWIREDWMSLNLYHNGDEEIYENDKDLILEIARSLTVN